jgi:DNA-binding SARP family transcriptional activator
LNTLYQVLEPDRKPGAESAFVLRDGTTYTLRPDADIWLDVEDFEHLARLAERTAPAILESDRQAILLKAMKLYQGEYLPETLYETWAAQERERLAVIFLKAADRLSELLLRTGKYDEVIELSQLILSQDNCWERAYRHLMQAYDHLGDHGQVGRTYQRCVQTLRAELDLAPSAETQSLYEQLAN